MRFLSSSRRRQKNSRLVPTVTMVRVRRALLVVALFGAPLRAGEPAAIGSLRLIGVRTIPLHQEFRGTIIGGLSGLDYDPRRDEWVAESDDKSEFGPARCYTLRLAYNEGNFTSVEPGGVTIFLQRDGTPYPDKPHALAHGGEVPDLESIRETAACGMRARATGRSA